jgi:hypothetical protein
VTHENRWSIAELFTRYDLEPELFDVFVEGPFDHDVLSHACSNVAGRPTFYEIDTVDVPDELLGRHGLSSGNKQRVVALARELGALSEAAKVICLADRDLDHWFGELEVSQRLRWTMFCCTENHFLTPEIVSDILLTTARARIKTVKSFFMSLTVTLRSLYALRLADRQLAWALKWVSLRKYLIRDGDTLRFDDKKYVAAVLNRNARSSQSKEFGSSYQQWMKKLDCDLRLSARGHDYTELLAWSVGEFGGQKEFASSAAIERLFVLLARSVATISTEFH